MMYTPTPATRRPRPPRSLSRQRDPVLSAPELGHTFNSGTDETQARPRPSAAQTRSKSSGPPSGGSKVDRVQDQETALSTYFRQRQQDARDVNSLARISASPADVSSASDVNETPLGTGSTSHEAQHEMKMPSSLTKSPSRPVGLGLMATHQLQLHHSSDMGSETSPPPPYGHMLPASVSVPPSDQGPGSPTRLDVPRTEPSTVRPATPPRQDSGLLSRQSQHPSTSPLGTTEHSSSRRRSILEPDHFASPFRAPGAELRDQGGSHRSDASDDEMSEGEVRTRLREVKTQLQQREQDLFIATQLADRDGRQHEHMASVLPQHTRPHLPAHLAHAPAHPAGISPSLRHLRSLSENSPYPLHVRRASSTSNMPLSSVGDYPPNSSAQHGDFSQPTGARYEAYGLDSHFHIVSPEQRYDRRPQGRHNRALGTIRISDTSPPYLHHGQKVRPPLTSTQSMITARAPSPRYERLSALQADAEDRIVALEQALAEARDSEESQRKVASRLRREMDKLQKELELADERRAEEEHDLMASVPSAIGLRHRAPSAKSSVDRGSGERQSSAQEDVIGNKLGWGSTTFPEFPASRHAPSSSFAQQGDGSYVGEPLGRVTIAALRGQVHDADNSDSSVDAPGNQSWIQTIAVDEMDSISATSHEDTEETRSTRNRSRTRSLSRKSYHNLSISSANAKGAHTESPSKRVPSLFPLTPRVTIESPDRTALVTSDDRPRRGSREGSIRRSPWPSPQSSVAVDVSPDVRRTLNFFSSGARASRSPSMSPAFASLSSRMTSMRAYVTHNLSIGPAGVGRTLGSELGSEFGEDWDRDVRSLDNVQWDLPGVTEGMGSPSPPSRARSNRSSVLLRQFQLQPTNSDQFQQDELDHDGTETDENDDTSLFSPITQPPLPLPANVSAALSSLAMALAPATMFASSTYDKTKEKVKSPHILPKGSLREPGLDYTTYELLNEACRSTRIRWAEEDSPPSSLGRPRQSADISEVEHRRSAKMLKDSFGTLAPLQSTMRSWSVDKDPWDGGEYPSDSSVSERENATDMQRGRKVPIAAPFKLERGKRPVSYLGPVRRDTPRRFALAHRRVNSAALICRDDRSIAPELDEPVQPVSRAKDRSPGLSDEFDGEVYHQQVHHEDQGGADKGKTADYRVPRNNELRPDQTLTRRGLRSIPKPNADLGEITVTSTSTASEPSTIPARMVHDIFCLLGICLEYTEWAVILFIRVCIDIRSGPGGTVGLPRRQRAKRYYL